MPLALKSIMSAEQLVRYHELIAGNADYELKGKTTPYTSLNGHMFSFLSKTGTMGLRLSQEDREQFIQQYNTQLMEQHGRVMKEFVEVPAAALVEHFEDLSAWLAKSYAHTASLKPKPTKK